MAGSIAAGALPGRRRCGTMGPCPRSRLRSRPCPTPPGARSRSTDVARLRPAPGGRPRRRRRGGGDDRGGRPPRADGPELPDGDEHAGAGAARTARWRRRSLAHERLAGRSRRAGSSCGASPTRTIAGRGIGTSAPRLGRRPGRRDPGRPARGPAARLVETFKEVRLAERGRAPRGGRLPAGPLVLRHAPRPPRADPRRCPTSARLRIGATRRPSASASAQAHNEAFADHWGSEPLTAGDLEPRLRRRPVLPAATSPSSPSTGARSPATPSTTSPRRTGRRPAFARAGSASSACAGRGARRGLATALLVRSMEAFRDGRPGCGDPGRRRGESDRRPRRLRAGRLPPDPPLACAPPATGRRRAAWTAAGRRPAAGWSPRTSRASARSSTNPISRKPGKTQSRSGHAAEAEAGVDPLGARHHRQGVEEDRPPPVGPGPVQAGRDEGRAHAPPLGRRVDGQHPDRRPRRRAGAPPTGSTRRGHRSTQPSRAPSRGRRRQGPPPRRPVARRPAAPGRTRRRPRARRCARYAATTMLAQAVRARPARSPERPRDHAPPCANSGASGEPSDRGPASTHGLSLAPGAGR